MIPLAQQQIGDVVTSNYRAAAVFKKYNIDFCCNGHRSISTACTEAQVNITDLLRELEQVRDQGPAGMPDFDTWSPDLLAGYIRQQHHRYVEKSIVEIRPYLHKICSVHGAAHPELFRIKELFDESAEELTAHMKKEETILFPYISYLVQVEKGDVAARNPAFGSLENPIAMMKEEHNDEGERFREISALTHRYTTPPDGCTTYRLTMQLLQSFEEDLHLHIHLENNILFPKSLQLEAAINNPGAVPGQAGSPIKRHPGLRALSREHHHALLLVWKIREGLRRNVTGERIEKYLHWFFSTHIIPHMEFEEKKVYPLAGNHPFVTKAIDHHTQLRLLATARSVEANQLLALADLLEQHIRFEERTLFNLIQERVPGSTLDQLHDSAATGSFLENEEDMFWQKSPVA